MSRILKAAIITLTLVALGDAIKAKSLADGEGNGVVPHAVRFYQVQEKSNQVCANCGDHCQSWSRDRPLFHGRSEGLLDCKQRCASDPKCKFVSYFANAYMYCILTQECSTKNPATGHHGAADGEYGNVMIYSKEKPGMAPMAPGIVNLQRVNLQRTKTQVQTQDLNVHKESNRALKESNRAKASTAMAFFISDDQKHCLEGPAKYIEKKTKEIRVSFLANHFMKVAAGSGSCAENGFPSGPHKSPCFKKAAYFTKTDAPLEPDFWDGSDSLFAQQSRKHICH